MGFLTIMGRFAALLSLALALSCDAFVPASMGSATVGMTSMRATAVDGYLEEIDRAEFAAWKGKWRKSYAAGEEDAAFATFRERLTTARRMSALLPEDEFFLNSAADLSDADLKNTDTSAAGAAPPSLISEMVGTVPWSGEVWDPFGFTDVDELNDEAIRWYRAAEVKHGRICMLAFTGWWVTQGLGYTFPGYLSSSQELTFKSVNSAEWFGASWDMVPLNGVGTILTVAGVLEFVSEVSRPREAERSDRPTRARGSRCRV